MRSTHPVTEALEDEAGRARFIYRLDLDPAVDDRIHILVGEFLFNVRSALDHLAVGMVAPKFKYRTQFPIFTEDPLKRDETTSEYLDNQKAADWIRWTEGMPDGAREIVRQIQPFSVPGGELDAPRDHVLALLSSLHNADKHRQLLTVMDTLHQIAVTIDGVTDYLVPGMHNGELILVSPTRAAVKIEGSARIAIGTSEANLRDLLKVFDWILNDVRGTVLPVLEPFLIT